jgi:allantoinase
LAAANPARRFRLRGKGEIAVGMDADLALVQMGTRRKLCAEELLYRHRHSPYVGRTVAAQVVRTILGGKTVFRDGRVVGQRRGRFLQP